MENEPLTTYLKTYRKRTGLTQEEVAFLLGSMCGTNVSRHELGMRFPTLRITLMYEFVLDTTARALYEGLSAEAMLDVQRRAKGLRASLAKKPVTKMREKKIAHLTRLISDENPAA